MASTIPPGGTDFAFIPIIPGRGLVDAQTIRLRATIDSISDSMSPTWSEHMDMGRADPKFMYNQFTRNISLDFKIIALQRKEHKDHMEAMNSLAALTYPIYKKGKGFNGIYVKMFIGNFIEVYGFISSLNFSVDNESPWIDDIPIYVNCSLEFRSIGEYRPNYRKPEKSAGQYGAPANRVFGKGIKTK